MTKDNTALLVMDVQPGIVDRFGNQEEYLNRLKPTIEGARQAGVPVIYVVVGFRPGFPEISPNNKGFSAIKDGGREAMVNPSPVVEPAEDEVVVTKRRISAFAGSDLDVILSAKGIKHLVLCGISTSGVVLSTTRLAADKDYQLTILSDLCLDSDEEVHRVLTEKILPRQAEVITAETWLKGLKSGENN